VSQRYLSAGDRAQMASDLTALTADVRLGVAVTYRDHTGRTFTPSTGAYAGTYTETAIRAVRTLLTDKELRAGDGAYQAGDVVFLFDRVSLTVTPAREDRIVQGGVTYEVLASDTDPAGLLWRIVARKVT
jgi:hypothetical protein